MSVAIATGGLFRDCCGASPVVAGGGGAPPYRQEGYNEPPFHINVKKVYIVDEKTQDIEHIVVVKDVWID